SIHYFDNVLCDLMSQILLVGEVVVVTESYAGPDAGYLRAHEGDKVQVLYMGKQEVEEEEGWIYAQKGQEEIKGWLPMSKVKTCRSDDDLVIAGRPPSPPSRWILLCQQGETIKVKYWGRLESEDERNWIWAERLNGNDEGWLSLQNVEQFKQSAAKENGRPWRQVLRKYDLLPFPDISKDREAEYATYEKRKVTVTPGLVVQVLEQKDDWTKVMLRQSIAGWMKTEDLSQDGKEPPPPPEHPPPAVPPRPLRPAPRPGQSAPERTSEAGKGPEKVEDLPPPPPPTEPQDRIISGGRVPTCVSSKISDADAAGGAARHILLGTFGLETLDYALADKTMEMGGGGSADVPEYLISESLSNMGFPSEIILDARMFPDPDAMHLTRHSGRHHLIISRLVQHRNFRVWLGIAKRRFREVVTRIERRGPRSEMKLSVAVYCRRGKHRSVAAACILHHIFQAEGFQCPDIKHLSYKHWKSCCKMACKECQEPPEELQGILQSATKLWRDL
ncbi:unnamed protein product, partial [Effrenium voratum]